MDINNQDTAVVITDPQNDFLSEQGAAWPLVKEGVKENNTIENIEKVFVAAGQWVQGLYLTPLLLPA